VLTLSGVPLNIVRTKAAFKDRLEELISVIYSRVQYLLPWGLYAFHRIIEAECQRRGIVDYNESILSIAYLVDAGVPNFDALRLVNLDFERVDATRLSLAFRRLRKQEDTDIIGWLMVEKKSTLYKILRGTDNRAIDFDFDNLIADLSPQK